MVYKTQEKREPEFALQHFLSELGCFSHLKIHAKLLRQDFADYTKYDAFFTVERWLQRGLYLKVRLLPDIYVKKTLLYQIGDTYIYKHPHDFVRWFFADLNKKTAHIANKPENAKKISQLSLDPKYKHTTLEMYFRPKGGGQ